MYVLRIEHAVTDYAAWKAAFDNDPIGRARSHVLRYRILRPVDDPGFAMIDLEFEDERDAEAAHAALREVWGRVTVMQDPRARIVRVEETRDVVPPGAHASL